MKIPPHWVPSMGDTYQICDCLKLCDEFLELYHHILNDGSDRLAEHTSKEPAEILVKILRQLRTFSGADLLHPFFSGVGYFV